MNMVTGEVSQAPVMGSFPMGSVVLPSDMSWTDGLIGGGAAMADVAAEPETVSYYTGINSLPDRIQDLQDFIDTYGSGPEGPWRQYTESFTILNGAQERHTDIINRQLISLHRWGASFFGSEFVRQQMRPQGLREPRLYTYADTPWEQPLPILPCPGGTPDFVCDQMARRVSATIPVGETYDNTEYAEFLINQNLVRQGYRGYGGPNTVPINSGEINSAPGYGPAPAWNGPNLEFNCAINVDLSTGFRPAFPGEGVYARKHSVAVNFNLQCVCDTTGKPVSDLCRIMAPGAADADAGMEFPAEFAALNVCGGFDTFNPAVPCETVIMQGVTPTPPNKLPGGEQIPQPQWDNGFPSNPYACVAKTLTTFVMDSPVAYENNYMVKAYYKQGNKLECQCDQFGNSILTTCRQATGGRNTLRVNADFGNYDFATGVSPYDTTPDLSTTVAQGLDAYPYTTGSYNENVVNQNRFPPFSAFPNYGPSAFNGLGGFRRQGADDEEVVESADGLNAQDYANFVAIAVAEAQEAAKLAADAAKRATVFLGSDAMQMADKAAYFAAQADVALAKAERLGDMVLSTVSKNKRRRRNRRNKNKKNKHSN